MLFVPESSGFKWRAHNLSDPPDCSDEGPGTFFLNPAHGGNAENSYTTLLTSGQVTEDVYGIMISFLVQPNSNNNNCWYFSLGADYGSGFVQLTPYMMQSTNCISGLSTPTANINLFPLFVPAGTAIGLKIYGGTTSAPITDPYVGIKVYGKGSRPETFPVAQACQVFGAPTIPADPPVATGLSEGTSDYGSWVQLNEAGGTTTTKPYWWWQCCVGTNSSIGTGIYVFYQFAYGDSTNKHIFHKECIMLDSGERNYPHIWANANMFSCFCPVPVGSGIYVRAYASASLGGSTLEAMAMGFY